MGILQNTWFIGISTGIISGIVVFFVTKWIMDKKGKKEYLKQINGANHAVINALKPYIADKGLPDVNIFNALIASNARIFDVNKKDMYSVEMYCEELIREIISDVYVSNDKKQEYTCLIATYTSNLKYTNIMANDPSVPVRIIYREQANTRLASTMAAVAVAPAVALTTLMIYMDDEYAFKQSVENFIKILFEGTSSSELSILSILTLLLLFLVSVALLIVVSDTSLEFLYKKISHRYKKDGLSPKKDTEDTADTEGKKNE